MNEINITTDKEKVNIVNESYAQRKVHDWNPMDYELDSARSIVNFIKSKGGENSVLSYSDSQIRAVLDHEIQDKPLDKAVYSFALSPEAAEWRNILGKELFQKQAVTFLKCRPDGEVEDAESLIVTLSKMNFVTKTQVDNAVEDHLGNKSVAFKSTSGEGSMKIKPEFKIRLKMLNEGILEEQDVTIELEINVPKEADQKLTITFSCIRWDRYTREAIKADQAYIIKELEKTDCLLLSGKI